MNRDNWDIAKAFHGHECPGLAIGVRVCEAAAEKMGIISSFDEELVCIAENDACGIDAVQALTGCTIGKGNLIFKNTGKQAFTFIKRDNNHAMRFYLKAKNNGMERSEYLEYILNAPTDDLFDCKESDMTPPSTARIFSSVKCEECGEFASENKIRLQNNHHVCMDCFENYDRGNLK